MELFRTNQYYIFLNGEHSLWWNRFDGTFTAKPGWDLVNADDPICLGICHGILGKLEYPNVFEQRLVIIKECIPVGHMHGNHVVYKIKSVAFLQLGIENELNLQKCQKHKSALPKLNVVQNNDNTFKTLIDQKNPGTSALSKTWGTLKIAGNVVKNKTQHAASLATSQIKARRNVTDRNAKLDRRLCEEFTKMFSDMDSFYFSKTGDITNTLQRRYKMSQSRKNSNNSDDSSHTHVNVPLWKLVDDRFFWNKIMLKDLLDLTDDQKDHWILPVIQGFIQIEHCKVEVGIDYDTTPGSPSKPRFETFTLMLISRRSRHRAGTRYKKRGVDNDGNCANYVETEQIICYHNHQISFVQVRGSVPVYWSQPGAKYRPPPRLDKGEEETKIAFAQHFETEFKLYGHVNVINLVEQTGREKVIWDAYSNNILKFNSTDITYITFDFHEYCRGMHFENISVLINAISSIVKDMNYCWVDKEGQICSQNGVFRVNCIDCLDRTNVVQTALAKFVMEIQFTKLGLISPEGIMPLTIRNTFQLLWANNGDTISKQYAGTNALKGDYTRTGERKLAGIMKDGMNSANRYYLSRFRDAYRQAAIDIILGNTLHDEIFNEGATKDTDEDVAVTEHLKLLIDECKSMFISDPDSVLGSWGLIDANPSTCDPDETEIDTILMLTKDTFYVMSYDIQVDKIVNYQQRLLSDIQQLEMGTMQSSISFFGSSNKIVHCIRICCADDKGNEYFYQFRSTNLRFFNNMVVAMKNEDEVVESLRAIYDSFEAAFTLNNLPSVPLVENQRFDKMPRKLFTSSSVLPRNVSDVQLQSTIKNVGSKAYSNMSEHLSKINRISRKLYSKPAVSGVAVYTVQPKFTIGDGNQPELEHALSAGSLSSNDSSEEDRSIFQPDTEINNFPQSHAQLTRQLSSAGRTHTRLIQGDLYLPDVGIVSGSEKLTQTHNNDVRLSLMIKNVTLNDSKTPVDNQSELHNPEIVLSNPENPQTRRNQLFLNLDRKLSRSTGEVESNKLQTNSITKNSTQETFVERSSSEYDMTNATCSITQSHSESALKLRTNIPYQSVISPGTLVAAATKDLVLSPFSKLAKGVQTFGANLDNMRRKSTYAGSVSVRNEMYVQRQRELQKKWQNSNTQLIAL